MAKCGARIERRFEELISPDDKTRMNALNKIIDLTDQKVDWIYEVWDDLFDMLAHENSFHRSIAIKVICNLSKSDSHNRLEVYLDRLLAHTRDEKCITSRQCLQTIWKVKLTSQVIRQKVFTHLVDQFRTCAGERYYNLIRMDILQSIELISVEMEDDSLLPRVLGLIADEPEKISAAIRTDLTINKIA